MRMTIDICSKLILDTTAPNVLLKKIAGDSSRQSVQVILFRMRTSTKTVA